MAFTRKYSTVVLVVGCLALSACGSDSSSDSTSAASTAPPDTEAPTTDPPATDPPATDAPDTVPPASVIAPTDTGFTIDWSAATPFYAQVGGGDPYFHIHNIPATDGFFFSLEMYTVYGTAWTGELGTFDIGCTPASTGICAHFDADGPGPLSDLGADFLATGSVTINQLDAEGYDVVVDELVFSDGTTITGLHLVG